jgi:ABC-type proline/glycine betaine transport systems, permease component
LFQQMWQYIVENRQLYITAIWEHVLLSVVVIVAAVLIGVSLGIFSAKFPQWSNGVISVFTFFRLIPSIALLILVMPLLKTGFVPSAVALTVLALPAICINTYSGIMGVDRLAIEAATGLGLSKKQIFTKVELPMAMPMIIVGIRAAFIDVISSATLAALVGAGGLGIFIFRGMMMNDMARLLIGGITIALIALLAELSLALWQRKYSRFI